MNSGIYSIINVENRKQYIGSSSSLSQRWSQHKWMLNGSYHHSDRLQLDWVLFGSDKFEFKIIETVIDESQLTIREQFWINYYDAANPSKGYNIENDAVRHTHSEETRTKISKSNKALKRKYVPTLETIERLRISHLGQPAWNEGLKLPKTKRICLECSKEFELEYKTSKVRFCSRSCRSKFNGRNFSKQTNIVKICKVCNKQFKTIQSQNNDYCSRTCYYKTLKGNTHWAGKKTLDK